MLRICQFSIRNDSTLRVGVVQEKHVVDITSLLPSPDLAQSMASPPDWNALAKHPSATRVPLDSVIWLPPITRPGKIICLGLNYADHAAEGGNAKPDYPSIFLRTAGSLIGHQAKLLRPQVSDKLDYEAELAVIIGRRSCHLTPSNALKAVAGYACFNDGTLRDYQRKSSQWTIGKNFDNTGGFGPWLVPASELPPGAVGLKIESRLNGQVMQSDNTRNMLFPVIETLCLVTEAMALEPGDILVMGTPAGVGYARKPPVWMKPGDRIEIEIEGIGILSNPVADDVRSAA